MRAPPPPLPNQGQSTSSQFFLGIFLIPFVKITPKENAMFSEPAPPGITAKGKCPHPQKTICPFSKPESSQSQITASKSILNFRFVPYQSLLSYHHPRTLPCPTEPTTPFPRPSNFCRAASAASSLAVFTYCPSYQ